ncbi:MAG: amidohydrolase family protein [Casimicrobiaceae bacterium]
MLDVVLRKGTLYDGSGKPGYVADIGVKADQISVIGDLGAVEAAEVVDVSGLAVSPGFIDLHTHSDFTLLANGRAESQVHQGVTTEVIGQCGSSCAPVRNDDEIRLMAIGYVDGCHHLGWRSFGEYLDALEGTALGVNVVAFVGHGAVHRAVLGDALRAGSPEEIDEMARLIAEAIDQGAGGFSTGLEYWPGILAAPQDLVPLCKAVAERNVLYSTHVRNRDSHYDLGFGEALATARLSGARLQISHIQPKFGAPSYAMEHTLEMIEAARRRDVNVAFDVIPHDWNHTHVVAILPQWAREGGTRAMVERLKDPDIRARIKNNPKPMWLLVRARRWSDIILLDAQVNRNLVGATFEEIGKIRGVDPYDAVFDLLIEEENNMPRLLWTSHSFREDDIDLCLKQQECAVISDTTALAPYGALKDNIGSLSGYGWAARFLQRYVHDRAVLSLPDAIRRLTSLPAERVRIRDRGLLRPGYRADVTVFDPNSIASNCSVTKPREYATGVAHVLVNGEFSMRDGRRTSVDAGRVLRDFGRCAK